MCRCTQVSVCVCVIAFGLKRFRELLCFSASVSFVWLLPHISVRKMTIDLYQTNTSHSAMAIRLLAKALNINLSVHNLDFKKEEHLKPEFLKVINKIIRKEIIVRRNFLYSADQSSTYRSNFSRRWFCCLGVSCNFDLFWLKNMHKILHYILNALKLVQS